jgi:exopolysaccharide biosynthesis polyprenyl glycosylphosphotransferase
MYRKQKVSWLKHGDFIISDLILLQISYIITYLFQNGLKSPYHDGLYLSTAIVIMLFDVCIGYFTENYSGILRRGYWQELKKTTLLVIGTTIGIIVYLFVLKVSAEYSRMFTLLFPCVSLVLLFLGRCILKLYLRGHRGPASNKRSIMLIVTKENYQDAVDNFKRNPYSEFHVSAIGILGTDEPMNDSYRSVPVYVGEEACIEYLRCQWVDEVLFSVPREYSYPEQMIRDCRTMGITVHIRLARIESEMDNQIVERLEGYTVLSSSMKISSNRQIFFKRAMDIAGGIVGMLMCGIFTIIVGPIIYIKSPGPIFFSQTRVGKNGHRFKIYKFRSMYMDAEERKQELMKQNKMDGLMFKIDDDPRIIKGIGHFIRKTSIDEFPQFWNVLKGDMSLVGTRPPTEDEWEQYEIHHRARLAGKPGITGMWQVSGRSDITDFEEVVKLDTDYISKWNIGLDIKILFQTILVVLERKGSV